MEKVVRTVPPYFRETTRTRTLEDAVKDLRDAPAEREKNKMRRRYSSRGTPATRRITNRIMGERDD
jgi:hypothetical protein